MPKQTTVQSSLLATTPIKASTSTDLQSITNEKKSPIKIETVKGSNYSTIIKNSPSPQRLATPAATRPSLLILKPSTSMVAQSAELITINLQSPAKSPVKIEKISINSGTRKISPQSLFSPQLPARERTYFIDSSPVAQPGTSKPKIATIAAKTVSTTNLESGASTGKSPIKIETIKKSDILAKIMMPPPPPPPPRQPTLQLSVSTTSSKPCLQETSSLATSTDAKVDLLDCPIYFRAISFIIRLRQLFRNDLEVYNKFISILKNYQTQLKNPHSGQTITETEVYEQISNLFTNHDNLIIEFRHYLPLSSAAILLNASNHSNETSCSTEEIPSISTQIGNQIEQPIELSPKSITRSPTSALKSTKKRSSKKKVRFLLEAEDAKKSANNNLTPNEPLTKPSCSSHQPTTSAEALNQFTSSSLSPKVF